MNDRIEKIELSGMEILSEFPVEYETGEELPAPHLTMVKRVFIGRADDFAVLASSAANGKMTADLALDRSNFQVLTEMLEKALKGDFDRENEEGLYVETGADKLGAGVNRNFPHTLTQPFERVYLINLRPIFLNEEDSLDQGYAGLKLPPKMAARLLEEMKKLLAENRI